MPYSVPCQDDGAMLMLSVIRLQPAQFFDLRLCSPMLGYSHPMCTNMHNQAGDMKSFGWIVGKSYDINSSRDPTYRRGSRDLNWTSTAS